MIQHDLNDAASGERTALAKSASDPLDRRDLARLLYGYLAGTAAIAVFGSVLLAAEVYPRPEHTTMEKLLLWTVMLSIPVHIPALLVIHRLDKAGLQRFAKWILFTSSFLLTALIHLSGTYTAIVGILIFTEIGMATLILAPKVAGLLVLLQFLQFAAIVVLEKLHVIPRQTILLDFRYNQVIGNIGLVGIDKVHPVRRIKPYAVTLLANLAVGPAVQTFLAHHQLQQRHDCHKTQRKHLLTG